MLKVQPSIESYEINIPLKQYSLESTSILHARGPVDDYEQAVLVLTSRKKTHRRLIEQSRPLWVEPYG